MRVLAAMFDGGGNTEPIIAVLSELRNRGADTTVVTGTLGGGPDATQLGQRVRALGLACHDISERTATSCDVRQRGIAFGHVGRPFWFIRRLHGIHAVAPYWSAAMTDSIATVRPDVVVADELLSGALVAGLASGLPTVAMSHTVYCMRPTAGAAPAGPLRLPRRGPIGAIRNAAAGAIIDRVYRRDVLPSIHLADAEAGRAPSASVGSLYDELDLIVHMSSKVLDDDFDEPHNLVVAGPTFTRERSHPAPTDAGGVLVSLTTTDENMARATHAISAAVAGREYEVTFVAAATIQPSLTPAPNVSYVSYVDHETALDSTRLVVCHGGHGTVLRALRAGVPVLAIPHCCDQAEVASRLSRRGLGRFLMPTARPRHIRRTIDQMLADRALQERAQRAGEQLRREHGVTRAADSIERIVARTTGSSPT